ncbi:hypothetical protein VTN77DRAFT_8884 [Rasamsonia byssochlamydoides]|uniref:uncharacterized protein n=1 Tax=Rasamsonia byssochlamydoides TaxID=89139 RepID=UPI003742A9AA
MATTTASSAASTFTPALKPPPGVIPNPEHPASLAGKSNLTIGLCVPFITVFFFCRSYVRLFVKRTWIAEDWLAFTAWAGTVAFCGLVGATMANHGGEHLWDIDAAEVKQANYWFTIASVEYGVSICLTKLAVLWLYRRIFSPRRWSPFDITIVTLIVLMILFYGITCMVKIFECTPQAKILDKNVPGHCIDESKLLDASGLFNTITDYIILFLPVHAVWKLQLTKAKKFLVVLVFTFGLCAPVFSTIGFVVRLKISGSPDTTWNDPEILLWGAAELTSGNLCLCFPEMILLFNRRARHRSKPSVQRESILKASAAVSRSRKIGPRDPDAMYIELDDNNTYGVHVTPARSRSTFDEPENGAVHVSYEITVESEEVK